MFDKMIMQRCALLLFGLSSAACSTMDEPRSHSVRNLPPSPMPEVRSALPQNHYIPQVFAEYKPRAMSPSMDDGYVPEKDYQDAYTTPFTPEPTPTIRVEPMPAAPKPVLRAPVKKPKPKPKPKVEDPSKHELDIDPFADIPERETLAVTRKSKPAATAPTAAKRPLPAAANALVLAAKAESAVGRHSAAMMKVERALRMEPQSPLLWHHLATFNYREGRYDQAVSLSRKSLNLATGNRDLVEKNLQLMTKVAQAMGNTKIFKEVQDYRKTNP